MQMLVPQTVGLAVLCRILGVFSIPVPKGKHGKYLLSQSSGSTGQQPEGVCASPATGQPFCPASSLFLTQRSQAEGLSVLHWPRKAPTQKGWSFVSLLIRCWFLDELGSGVILKDTFAIWVCTGGTLRISCDKCFTRVTLWGDTFLVWVIGMAFPCPSSPYLFCESL